MSQSIEESDVRAITSLLGRVAIMPGDALEKRRAVLDGLCEIVGATRWFWFRGTVRPSDQPVGISTLHGGWPSDDKQLAMFIAMAADNEHMDPGHRRFGELFFQHGHTTRTRHDLIDDGEFESADSFEKYYRFMDHHQYLLSAVPLSPDTYSGIALFRHREAAAFGPRERLITHIITSEIDWLHRAGFDVADTTTQTARDLSRRLRQVLVLLIAGNSPKQISRTLNLSTHTIRDYVKELHKRFNVSGTNELLSHFASGGGPKL